MKTATELFKALTDAGLEETEVNGIILGKIKKGEIEDDGYTAETVGKSLSFDAQVAAVEACADAISKAMGGTDDIAKSDDTPDIAKGDGVMTFKEKTEKEQNVAAVGDGSPKHREKAVQKADGEYEDEESESEEGEEEEEEGEEEEMSEVEKAAAPVASNEEYDVVAIISKGADQILDSVERQNTALAKGYGQLNDTLGTFAKAFTAQNDRIKTLESHIESIAKALDAPLPPRAVTGTVEPVPAPGEVHTDQIEKSGIGGVNLAPSELIAKAMEEIKNDDTDGNRKFTLLKAVSEIDSGVPATIVAARYNIN